MDDTADINKSSVFVKESPTTPTGITQKDLDAIHKLPPLKPEKTFSTSLNPRPEKGFIRRVWERWAAPALIVSSALGVGAKTTDPNLVDAANLAGIAKDNSSNPAVGAFKGAGEFMVDMWQESKEQETAKKAFNNTDNPAPAGWKTSDKLRIDAPSGKYVISKPNANEASGERFVTLIPKGSIVEKAFVVPDETPGNKGGIMYAVEINDSYKDKTGKEHIVKKYGYITGYQVAPIPSPKKP